jgi:hypothetical protein
MHEFTSINKYTHEHRAMKFYEVKHETPLFNLGRDSSIGVLTGYGLDGRSSIPDRRKRFYLLHSV